MERRITLQTQIFHPEKDKNAIAEAAAILRRGGLLGIPTETVYGLGADALNETAVLHIFEAKGRPQDNPLILHVPGADWLERYCHDIPPEAYALAERFWPGPLTMILPRRDNVPLRTTGGLETVGVRCPNHPMTLAIIRKSGIPVAAPSGNTSGRPSPTTAQHMLEDMDGKIDGIVDGGPCSVGVESTIIDLTVTPPRLLRPGDTAIDIGANLGYYTRPMSRIVGPEGRVYAVEPVPVICEVLRRNLRGRDNVHILNCALGDGDRPVEMANDSVAAAGYFGTGRNFVDDGRNARGDAIRFKAQMRRGSSLFADVDRIDFIKCDIEGYECVVLGEMMPLVRRHHPTILVESGGDNRRSLIAQFGSEGYAPFTLGDDGREHPLDTAADDGRDIIFRYKEPIEQ